jgi:hypothetical protein
MKTFLLSPRLAAVVLSACGVMVWQDAQAHDAVSSLFLSGENGTLTVRDSEGNPLEGNVWQGVFGIEREWDERAIYDHVNGEGTPVDASGDAAYTGVALPHLRASEGAVKNNDYATDDYAWRDYPNSAALAVVPAGNGTAFPGSVDNKPIRLEILSGLKVWNGSAFVPTGGESLDVSVWTWTLVDEDGVADVNDTRRFPDGGWYAYPDDTVRLDGTPITYAGYDFYPEDHYHWLLELSPDAQEQREVGIYAVRVRFATADGSLAPSQAFNVVLAQGMGDWETATHTPAYEDAVANLTAFPGTLEPPAQAPDNITYARDYFRNVTYNSGYDQAMAHLTENATAAAAVGLYSASSIQDMNLGGVVLQGTGGNATLQLRLQTTSNLSQPFQDSDLVEIPVQLQGNKGFLRVRALGPQ